MAKGVTKGKEAEREVARALNGVLLRVASELGVEVAAHQAVQRNQQQSAIGGMDLTNTHGLSIEVKRQEQLSLATWWAQAERSAKEVNGVPVLVYRRNRQAWAVRVPAWVRGHAQPIPVEMAWDAFLALWEDRVRLALLGKALDGPLSTVAV